MTRVCDMRVLLITPLHDEVLLHEIDKAKAAQGCLSMLHHFAAACLDPLRACNYIGFSVRQHVGVDSLAVRRLADSGLLGAST